MSAGIFFILKYFPGMVFLCPSDKREGKKRKGGFVEIRGKLLCCCWEAISEAV